MPTISGSGSRCQVKYDEGPRLLNYSLDVDGHRAIYGEVHRAIYGEVHKDYPGWKRVWAETLVALLETSKSIESGTGLQSRAFQQSPSTKGVYSASGTTSK